MGLRRVASPGPLQHERWLNYVLLLSFMAPSARLEQPRHLQSMVLKQWVSFTPSVLLVSMCLCCIFCMACSS